MKKIVLALCIMALVGCCGCGEKEPAHTHEYVDGKSKQCNQNYR